MAFNMWYKKLGFIVDEDLREAISNRDLDTIKRLLIPYKPASEISLDFLLFKLIQSLGKIKLPKVFINFSELREASTEAAKEEGKNQLREHLTNSIKELCDLIDYLVSQGADINNPLILEQDKISCSDGVWERPTHSSMSEGYIALFNQTKLYEIQHVLCLPLAVGKKNAAELMSIWNKAQHVSRSRYPGQDKVKNKIKEFHKNVLSTFTECNEEMQIALIDQLIGCGADVRIKIPFSTNKTGEYGECIFEFSHTKGENDFLGFVKDCVKEYNVSQKILEKLQPKASTELEELQSKASTESDLVGEYDVVTAGDTSDHPTDLNEAV